MHGLYKLNPVRAGMASTPEESHYTSIKERLTPQFCLKKAIQEQIEQGVILSFPVPLKPLCKFEDTINNQQQTGIFFSLESYLELIDYTGRIIRPDKRGAIPLNLPPILQRLHLNMKVWRENSTNFEKNYRRRFSKPYNHRSVA